MESTALKRSATRRLQWIVVGLFALAFASRLGIAVALGVYRTPFRVEVHNIAMSLASGRGYGNPYWLPTGPAAHNSPLYPLLMAGVFVLLGPGQSGELGIYTLNTVAVAAVYALLPPVALALRLPIRLGVSAAMPGILAPVHYLIELRGGEFGFCALFLVILFLATAKLWRQRAFNLKNGILHGLGWGIALLLSPSPLPVGVAWLAAAFRRYGKRVVTFGAALSLAGVSVLAPWAARNKAVLGHAVFLRSNFGLELQVSNNELARATLADNMKAGTHRAYHPYSSFTQAERVRRLGEVAYNREKLDQALQWIRTAPWKFSELTLARVVLFWFPKTTRWWQSATLWALTLLALAGWFSVKGRHRAGFVLIQLVWLVYPAIYYVIQTDNRYRCPPAPDATAVRRHPGGPNPALFQAILSGRLQ
jgi:hypothetical protein